MIMLPLSENNLNALLPFDMICCLTLDYDTSYPDSYRGITSQIGNGSIEPFFTGDPIEDFAAAVESSSDYQPNFIFLRNVYEFCADSVRDHLGYVGGYQFDEATQLLRRARVGEYHRSRTTDEPKYKSGWTTTITPGRRSRAQRYSKLKPQPKSRAIKSRPTLRHALPRRN